MKSIFLNILAFLLFIELNAQEFNYNLYFEENYIHSSKDSSEVAKIALNCLKKFKERDIDTVWRMKNVTIIKTPKNTVFNDSAYNEYSIDYEHFNQRIFDLRLNIDSLILFRNFVGPASYFDVYDYTLKGNSLNLKYYKRFRNHFLEFEVQYVDSNLAFIDSYKNGYKYGTSYHLFKKKIVWECKYKDSFNFVDFEKCYYNTGKIKFFTDYNKLTWTFYSENSEIIREEKIDIYGYIVDSKGNRK